MSLLVHESGQMAMSRYAWAPLSIQPETQLDFKASAGRLPCKPNTTVSDGHCKVEEAPLDKIQAAAAPENTLQTHASLPQGI